jgi:D-alanyl-D-alanine carboxypeptidase
MRTPLAALLLTTLASLSPTLALAPLSASEPVATSAVALDAGEAARTAGHSRTSATLIDDVVSIVRPAAAPVADAPATAPAAVTDQAKRFQSALEAARATGGAYGVTFAAVRDGQLLWAGGSGRARDGRTALEAGSPLVIGSVTKTFVAATVLQLVEEGRMRLDAPMRKYLPELRHISGEITIAQLLDHTSGLADVFNDTTRAGLEEHPEHAWTAEEVLGSLHDPWYAPGDGWAYANTNYYLLGMVIERVTGTSLADELDRRFFEPLSLPSTHILDGTEAGGPLQPAWTSIFWGSGAMSASAADLARWGDALYGDGVLRPETRTAMLKLNDDDYGFGVQKVEVGGTKGYGHTGLLNTYTTLLYHLPKERVTVALLVNRSHVDLGAMLMASPGGGQSLIELALGD